VHTLEDQILPSKARLRVESRMLEGERPKDSGSSFPKEKQIRE